MSKTETRSKRYLVSTLGLMLALTAVLALTNFAVDPYGIYREWEEGDVFPASGTYERLHKTERIKRVKPDVLILGTSRANIGIDPDEEFFPGLTPYNAGASAATIREHRLMLEYAYRVRPLKKVVLSLDLLSFNTKRPDNRHFKEHRVAPGALSPQNSFFNTYGTIFSFDTLTVVAKHLRYVESIHRQSYPEANGHKQNDKAAWIAKKRGVHSFFRLSPNSHMYPENFSYAYSDTPGDTTFQDFRAILEFCAEKNIELYIYIGPMHKIHLDMFVDHGMQDIRENWKKKLVEIARPFGVPLWDFSTYHDIAMEPLPPEDDTETQMRWFWDTDHYKTEAGDIVMRKILGLPGADAYPGFGEKLL